MNENEVMAAVLEVNELQHRGELLSLGGRRH